DRRRADLNLLTPHALRTHPSYVTVDREMASDYSARAALVREGRRHDQEQAEERDGHGHE
ncbi:MAG: hypothetical protein ACTHNK_19435, partial [Thermomicrobiales bacterium]